MDRPSAPPGPRPLLSVLLATLLATPGLVAGDELPFARLMTATGGTSGDLALGDLDGDGRRDVAVADTGGNELAVLWHEPDGRLVLGPVTRFDDKPYDAAAGDLDADGRDDLVLAQADISGDAANVVVLLGQADRTLVTLPAFAVDDDPRGLALGDLDGDGVLDLALARAGEPAGALELWSGQGDGTFVASQTLATLDARAVALLDATGDGLLDAAVSGVDELSPFALEFAEVQLHAGLGDGTVLDGDLLGPTVAGESALGLSVADLDGDGRDDLVVGLSGVPSQLGVWLAEPSGRLGPVQLVPTSGGSTRVTAGDIDLDGRQDLLHASVGPQSRAVTVLPGDGAGGFGTPQTLTRGPDVYDVVTTDLDGDGRDDLVISSDRGVGFARQTPQADFGTVELDVGNGPSGLALADLDADGVLDLVVPQIGIEGTGLGEGVDVALGRGDGRFGPVAVYEAGREPRDVAVADLDGDGVLDVAVAHDRTTPGFTGGVAILPGLGDGGFGPELPAGFPGHFWQVEAADVDADGDLDLVALDTAFGRASTLVGQGDLTFSSEVLTPLGPQVTTLRVVDVTGDGLPDVVANRLDQGLDVLPGLGDGAFGPIQDIPLVDGGGFGPRALDVDDVDGDGLLDIVSGHRNDSFLLRGLGAGAFAPAEPLGIPLLFEEELELDDVDGDGACDLLRPSDDGGLAVHWGAGDGTFPASVTLLAGTGPGHVAVGDADLDTLPDVVTVSGTGTDVVVSFQRGTGSWSDVGQGLAGTFAVPRLIGFGTLAAGTPFGVRLENTLPLSSCFLVLSFETLGAPFKGGVLVPDPAPPALIVDLPTDAEGGAFVPAGDFPPGAPPGSELVLQGWIPDPAGPVGFSATNGSVGTTP